MALSIAIVSEFNGKGLEKAVKEFKNLETTSQKANFAIRKAAVPAAAAVVGIAVALGQATKAAIDDQKSQELLAKQLENTTGATTDQIKSNEDFIKKMSYSAGVADEILRPALGNLVRATGDVKEAQKLLALGLDISAGTSRDLTGVSLALAKAQNGQFTALTRLGIPLEKNIIKTKDFDAATAVLAKTFEGAAATSANTLEGRMRVLRIRMDETKEAIGTALLPVIEKFVPLLTSMAKFAERNASVIGGVTIALGLFAGAIVAARVALSLWKGVSIVTTAVNWALSTSFTAVQVATGIGIATALAGAAAFMIIKGKMDKARESATAYSDALKPVIASQQQLNDYVGPVATRDFTKFTTGVTNTIPKLDDFKTKQDKAAEAARKLKERVQEAKDAVRKDMTEALQNATDKLKTAQDAFDDFGSGVAKSIKSSFSFGDAMKDAADASKELKDAQKAELEAQKKLVEARKGDDPQKIIDAQRELMDVRADLNKASEKPLTFFGSLTAQADKVKKFAGLTKQLLAAGLSERALQQVLEAGVDSGTAIAEELLNGAGSVLEANKLADEIETLSKDVGLDASTRFYYQGVQTARAYLKGIEDTIAATELKLNVPGLSVGDIKGIGAEFNQTVNPDPLLNEFDNWVRQGMPGFSVDGIGVPMFANGGIVTKPTLGVIGEAGPEAIIPLSQMSNMGGNNVTINVNGGDPNAVVNALRTYMRQNGSIPIKVSNIY